MVIPHDAGRAISIKVPVVWIYAAAILAVFSVLVVGSSFVYSSVLSRRLVHYSKAVVKNREQQKAINSFAQETKRVNEARRSNKSLMN
jgi:hypothetical protein